MTAVAEKSGFKQDRLLKPLSEIISFDELKRLRLVCKDINEVIKTLDRYCKSEVKFESDWKANFKNVSLKTIPKWKNVHLSYLQFKSHHFSGKYWEDVRQNLTTLVLYKLRATCDDLAVFLNVCRSLENLTIEKVYFYKTSEMVGENGQQRNITTYCPHTGQPPTMEVGTITVRRIIFKMQNIIPICILGILRKRCQGRLVEFGCNGQTMSVADRMLCIPHRTLVCDTIKDILRENVNTLTTISLCNNVSGELGFMSSLPNEIQNLVLRNVSLANTKEENSSPLIYMNFLENLNRNALRLGGEVLLEKLELNIIGDVIHIGELVNNLLNHVRINLKLLRLEFVGTLTGAEIDLNVLQEANNLTTLSIIHKSGYGHINQQFLQNLPAHMQHLSLQLKPNEIFHYETFVNFIENIRVNNIRLTKLFIGKAGDSLTDKYMHEIMRGMPLLQELQITGASRLTDNGLCSSISKELSEEILKCKSYFLLSEPPLKFEEANRYNDDAISIARLTSLRRVTFKKCNISDVSIRLAFHLPNIRTVDLSNNLNASLKVSDTGLFWLCQQNPSIEQLVIQDNMRVSHFGINQLVTCFPTLMKILTTKQVHDRHFEGLQYPKSVHFDNVVTVFRG